MGSNPIPSVRKFTKRIRVSVKVKQENTSLNMGWFTVPPDSDFGFRLHLTAMTHRFDRFKPPTDPTSLGSVGCCWAEPHGEAWATFHGCCHAFLVRFGWLTFFYKFFILLTIPNFVGCYPLHGFKLRGVWLAQNRFAFRSSRFMAHVGYSQYLGVYWFIKPLWWNGRHSALKMPWA